MATLAEMNKTETLSRLRCFGGNRVQTAASLGISLRTLGMWLKEWGVKTRHLTKQEQTMHKYIRATKEVITGTAPNETKIARGAIGLLREGTYFFHSTDVQPELTPGQDVGFVADELMAKHQWDFEQASVGSSHDDRLRAGSRTTAVDLDRLDLSHLSERTYYWSDQLGRPQSHTFTSPKAVFCKRNGSTHRVEDEFGVITFVPAPGFFGCVIKQKAKDGQPRMMA